MEETKQKQNSVRVMAVDNLPSELPRESSFEFGNGIVKNVLPYIINKDDGRILNATLTNNGFFLKVGLISYSLYLWHQPIYQYFNLVFITDFSGASNLPKIISVAGLGMITFHCLVFDAIMWVSNFPK